MQNIKKIIAGVFCAAISVVTVLSGCGNVHYSDDLFDGQVLKHYNLSWLEKPQGAQNEQSVNEGNDKSTSHYYSCTVESVEVFEEYVAQVFNTFKEKNYSVVNYLRNNSAGELWTSVYWIETQNSDNLEDFYKLIQTETEQKHMYCFYYSLNQPGKYNEEYHGQILPNAWQLVFWYYESETQEERNYNFSIGIHSTFDVYVITDEEYLTQIEKEING